MRCRNLLVLLALSASSAVTAQRLPPVGPLDAELKGGLEWRNVGPFRGGRVTAVSGVLQDDQTFYMGATGGGVWKTDDAGINWRNISDGYFKSGSVGAIAVARAVHAVAGRECLDADAMLAHADIEDLRVRGRDGDRAD